MNISLQVQSFICLICFLQTIHGYLNVHLSDQLCVEDAAITSITLLDNNESAAIFKQQWNVTSNTFYDCQFELFSNMDSYRIPRGTYIVINHLRFRRDPITQTCIDYIQFESSDGSPSPLICGDTMKEGAKTDFILDYSSRKTIIKLHINNSVPLTDPLELGMVVTAHSQCNHKNDLLCEPNKPYSCISRHFVQDNITNCLAPCLDETECFQEMKVSKMATVRHNKKTAQDGAIDLKTINLAIGLEDDDGDNSRCITVRILEEKLNENVQTLRKYLRQTNKSLLKQLGDEIKGSIPEFEALNKICATKEEVQNALNNHMKGLEQVIQNLVVDYKKNFENMNQRLANLERKLSMN